MRVYLRVYLSAFSRLLWCMSVTKTFRVYIRNGSIDGCLQYHRKNKIKTGGGFGGAHTYYVYNILL